VGARFSAPVQTGPEAHPASNTMGTGTFPGIKRPGRGVDHPPHLAPRLRKSSAIPLLPLWAFVTRSRVNFIFTFTFTLTLFVHSVVLRSQIVDGEVFFGFRVLSGHSVDTCAPRLMCESTATLPTERSQAAAVAQLNIDRTLEQSHRQSVALANSG